MYWVAGLPGFPIQNVSVRAAKGASRSVVVVTVAPSGTTAIAASAAATCASMVYVDPCHRALIGHWNASATAIAAIIAPPCRAAPVTAASTRPYHLRTIPESRRRAAAAAGGQEATAPGAADEASAGLRRHRPMASAAAMNTIGI